jgi:hypothetical protein
MRESGIEESPPGNLSIINQAPAAGDGIRGIGCYLAISAYFLAF